MTTPLNAHSCVASPIADGCCHAAPRLSPAPAPDLSADPLSADHRLALTSARARMKKISLAAGLARCGGWTLGFFAVLTFGLGIPNDPVSLALGLALGVVAWNELRGGAMLRRLDVSAARLLGCNQLALGVLTVVYACWQLAGSSDGSALRDAIGSSGGPEASELLDRAVGDLGALSAIVSYAVYGTLAIVGALIPGLTAWYYFSRARLVRELRASTPEWALRILAV